MTITTDKSRYMQHFPTSKKLFETALKYLPAGVSSTSRATWSGWNPYPLFIEKGTGSHIIDVDGNEFIDYLLGLGPMLLGHRPKEITDAVTKQIQNSGTIFALGSKLEIEAANKGPVDKLTFSVFLFSHVFCNAIKRLVNSVIQIAFTSRFRFHAVADKRHSSVAF